LPQAPTPSTHRASSMHIARSDRHGVRGAAWPRQR
jgi:hypothetical protein